MPTGANAYLFAVKYDRAVGSVSGAILITTALAWFTLMLLFGALSSDRT
jgi:predicted permease